MHKPFFCLIFALAKAIDHEAPSFGSTIHRGVEQLAARRAHNPEVGGSSPPPATTADDLEKSSAFFVPLPGPCRALFLPRELDFCSDVRIFENGSFPCSFFSAFSMAKSGKRKSVFPVLLGSKVPKASARRFPRERAICGAARGAQDQALAPPRGGRAAARPLFFRVKRECGLVVPPMAAK